MFETSCAVSSKLCNAKKSFKEFFFVYMKTEMINAKECDREPWLLIE